MLSINKNSRWGSDQLWNRVAWASGIFAVLICVLLVANYVQTKKADPVNMTVINSLVGRLYENPADSVLRKQIRTLDLLSRKAYFTSQWQIRTGGYFLLAAVALIVLSLQIIEYRKKVNPIVSEENEDELHMQRRKARNWIVIGGSALLLIAVVFAVLASNELSDNFYKLSKGTEIVSETPAAIPEVSNLTDTISGTVSISEVPDTSAVVSSVTVSTDNYPNFRGVAGTASKKGIPVSWDGKAGTNVLWKTQVPLPGYNSPIVWGDKVFLTGANTESREVYCFDRNSGQLLWTAKVGSGTKKPAISEDTGYSAPTAVTDGNAVYAIFSSGEIAAIDMNGKKIWERDFGLPENHYGHSSSLLYYKGNIIVQYDQKVSPRVMALSAKTGATVWSTDRPVKVSWSSPILVNTGKRDELILVAEPYVASYNPANGQELWKIDCIAGEVGPSLAFSNGIVFSVNEYSKLSAVKIDGGPSILWENNNILSEIPSPAADEKYLFLTASYGTVVCNDAITGEKYWETELGNSIFSSPMIVEGKVYMLDRSGVMHIIKADREYKVIGEPALGEESACTPAFTNGRIYIRGESNLYCIGK